MQSSVDFCGTSRIHIALTVADIERAVAFYRDLFDREPVKVRPGYAKFEPDQPALNLALNEDQAGVRPLGAHSHFGIQLKSTEAVVATRERLTAIGLATRVEEQVTCCHAVQDKFWVEDPDGHAWEVFVVTQSDTKEHSIPAAAEPAPIPEGSDRAPTCCT